MKRLYLFLLFLIVSIQAMDDYEMVDEVKNMVNSDHFSFHDIRMHLKYNYGIKTEFSDKENDIVDIAIACYRDCPGFIESILGIFRNKTERYYQLKKAVGLYSSSHTVISFNDNIYEEPLFKYDLVIQEGSEEVWVTTKSNWNQNEFLDLAYINAGHTKAQKVRRELGIPAHYNVYSEHKIPEKCKNFLDARGISYREEE